MTSCEIAFFLKKNKKFRYEQQFRFTILAADSPSNRLRSHFAPAPRTPLGQCRLPGVRRGRAGTAPREVAQQARRAGRVALDSPLVPPPPAPSYSALLFTTAQDTPALGTLLSLLLPPPDGGKYAPPPSPFP